MSENQLLSLKSMWLLPTFVVDVPAHHGRSSPRGSHPWWNPRWAARNDPRRWPSNLLLRPKAVPSAPRCSLGSSSFRIWTHYKSMHAVKNIMKSHGFVCPKLGWQVSTKSKYGKLAASSTNIYTGTERAQPHFRNSLPFSQHFTWGKPQSGWNLT